MAKQIKLPGGALFDPETGELQGLRVARIPTQSRSLSRSNRRFTYRPRRNIWSRFNDFISGIGDWLASHSESITNYFALGLVVISCLWFVVAVISTWINEGFFLALLGGIIGGVIFYYISMLILGLFIYVINIALVIVRYVFYNAYTFLILISIIFIMLISTHYRYISLANNINDSQYSVPLTTKYICTAKTALNIRYAPNLSSKIIGSLKPNEIVEVYGIIGNFAKIKYGTGVAYASSQYLKDTP